MKQWMHLNIQTIKRTYSMFNHCPYNNESTVPFLSYRKMNRSDSYFFKHKDRTTLWDHKSTSIICPMVTAVESAHSTVIKWKQKTFLFVLHRVRRDWKADLMDALQLAKVFDGYLIILVMWSIKPKSCPSCQWGIF